MDIYREIKCPKCSGEMMKSTAISRFVGRRNDGMIGETETVKYMCTSCGYVEERALNPFFWQKIK